MSYILFYYYYLETSEKNHISYGFVLQANFVSEADKEREKIRRFLAHLLTPAVLPGDPVSSISRITEVVAAGELPTEAICVAALRAYQRQEVKCVQVHLKILRSAGKHGSERTPGTVPLACTQPTKDQEIPY